MPTGVRYFLTSLILSASHILVCDVQEGLPLFYWKDKINNFGDYLSFELVQRIVGNKVQVYTPSKPFKRKLLAIGSIMTFARENDVVWGSGINGKWLEKKHYRFTDLDVRAVRGPITRKFLMDKFGIVCPKVYGDPALLIPYFFPEFTPRANPSYTHIIIPHYSEKHLFPKDKYPNVVYPTEPWDVVIQKILDSEFVISSSLHGIIVAEAYGIPARLLRVTNNEPLLKYRDYYLGTHRPQFKPAYSIEEALGLGGEPPMRCDLKKLYEAFPFDLWPHMSSTQYANELKGERCII